MSGQRSFRQVSDVNHASLVEFIQRLHDAGLKFPARGGVVNKTAVARACGFARETFQQNPRFAATLDAAVTEIGIEVPEAGAEPAARNNEEKARILQLEQQLAVARSEALDLRRKLRRYEAIAEHVGTTGPLNALVTIKPNGVGIVRFLAERPEFAGVGKATAQKLWDRIGGELYGILGSGNVTRLAEVLPATQAEIVSDAWGHQQAVADCVVFFDKHGFDPQVARKAVGFWGEEALPNLQWPFVRPAPEATG
jgi:hypothetical protein